MPPSLKPPSLAVYGQGKKNIKGLVTDEKNEPLIGVSVVEVGTSNGTITDVDGKFEINVSSNSTLKFSYIGYNVLEKKIGTQTVMNVVLTEAASELDEVVVVGYGTVKKRDLTGSVTSVDSEKLLQSPALSAAEAIQGKVPGVLIQNTSWTPPPAPRAPCRRRGGRRPWHTRSRRRICSAGATRAHRPHN